MGSRKPKRPQWKCAHEVIFIDCYRNTKNVTTVDIVYAHMLHCMIKLRQDLESTHQRDCFGQMEPLLI